MPTGRTLNSNAPTRVQFLPDQVHLLAVHETQVAICIVPTQGVKQLLRDNPMICKLMEFMHVCEQSTQPHIWTWFPSESRGAVTDAACSCDSESVFVSFEDGSLAVLALSTLILKCTINQTAYLPSTPSNRTFPVALGAHPSKPNQFALGLSDGQIYVLEPLESKVKCEPPENG